MKQWEQVVAYFDTSGLEKTVGLHVHDFACIAINTPGMFPVRMFRLRTRQL